MKFSKQFLTLHEYIYVYIHVYIFIYIQNIIFRYISTLSTVCTIEECSFTAEECSLTEEASFIIALIEGLLTTVFT
jgi:hypothetical protein